MNSCLNAMSAQKLSYFSYTHVTIKSNTSFCHGVHKLNLPLHNLEVLQSTLCNADVYAQSHLSYCENATVLTSISDWSDHIAARRIRPA